MARSQLTLEFRTPLVDDHGLMTRAWQKKFAGFYGFDSIPLPNYASNALALAAGLKVNDFYRNGDTVCVVH